MRFTEHELTVGLTGAAKYALSMQNRDVRRGTVDIDAMWNSIDKLSRFHILDGLSEQVLPVLVALPDVEFVVGEPISYPPAVIKEHVENHVGQVVGLLKRAATVKSTVELVKAALAAMPPRQDPDALIVPDHL